MLSVGDRLGIPRSEAERLLVAGGKVLFAPPVDPRLRLVQLVDLVQMMICDGQIEGNELRICHSFARAMGFHPNVLTKVTAALLASAGAQRAPQSPTIDAASFLSETDEVEEIELVFHCPHCAEPFSVLREVLGQKVSCHSCAGHIALPDTA